MAESDGLWATISELARLRGVDKAAISRRVTRLEAQGLLQTRHGKGGTKLVNVAAFDRATEETTDAIRELNGAQAAASAVLAPVMPGDPILAREQARRDAYSADLSKLDLDERLGKLMPVEDHFRILDSIYDPIVRMIDQMPDRADEMEAAEARDGAAGRRNFLRRLALAQREAIDKAMSALAESLARGAADGEAA